MIRNGGISVYCIILIGAVVLGTMPEQAAGQVTPSATGMASTTPVILPFAPAEPPASPQVRPKIIFIIGQGDPQTAGKLISGLAEQLLHQFLYFGDGNWVVPEPMWTLGTFLTQCAADPDHTQGAFVVGLDSSANMTRDHFFSRSAYVDITAHILYAQCNMQVAQASGDDSRSKTPTGQPKRMPTTKPTPKSAFVWFSNSISGKGTVDTLTLVSPLSLAVALGSLSTAFIPSKSQVNTTTKTFPSSPPPGTVNTSTSASAFSPNSNNSLAGAVFAGGATYNANPSSALTGDLQTWLAVHQAMVNAVKSMNCPPNPLSTPEATDEKHRHPASQGPAKAPFCQGWVPTATPPTTP
jgi:hypothetical protein